MMRHHLLFVGIFVLILGWGLALPAADAPVPPAPAANNPAPSAPESPPAPQAPSSPTTAPAAVPAPVTAPSLAARMTALPSGGNIAIIPIKGMIYDFTVESFTQRAQKAIQDGASVIVIELDTPGGLLTSAIKLSKAIKQLKVHTVAWVNNEAYSAGTLLASACDFIIMSPRSTLGDCAPIAPGQNLAPTERAKFLSPLLEEFRDSAQRNHYDFAMFQAMSELGIELYLIEHAVTGQRHVVNRVDYEWMVRGNDIAAPAVAAGNQPAPPVPSVPGLPPSGAAGPLEANELLGVTRQIGRNEDQGQWRPVLQGRFLGPIIQPVHDGRSLLTLSQDRALEFGLAQALIADDAQLQQFFGAKKMGRYSPTMVQGIAYWLSQPWIRALLLIIMFICFYLEFQAPGLSIPGFIGGAALVCLLGAPFLVGLAEWWHVLLVLTGFGLLIFELFVMPGFTFPGLIGMIMIFAGLAMAATPSTNGLPAPETMRQLQWQALSLVMAGIIALVAIGIMMRHFGRLPVFYRLVLASAQKPVISASRLAQTPSAAILSPPTLPLGALGQAVSELKPTGQAEFNGSYLTVSSQGEWIAARRPLRVLRVEDNVIIVEEVPDTPS